MNTIDNPPAARERDLNASIARTGFRHRIFSCRTLVGLLAVAIGCLLVHPRNFYGHFDLAVKCFSVALVLAGLALRAWGAASAGGHRSESTGDGRTLCLCAQPDLPGKHDFGPGVRWVFERSNDAAALRTDFRRALHFNHPS